jgi:FAD/FMN-containing dehydrogenase
MEVVLADGTVLDLLRSLHKDNSGFHLKQLFIGSEGSLGVVTRLALQLAPKPRASAVALLRVGRFADAASLLRSARRALGEVLSAFEFVDVHCLEVLRLVDGSGSGSGSGMLARVPASVLPKAVSTGEGVDGEILVLVECQSSDTQERLR